MALLAGNIGLKILGRPQFLVFVIPWVRKNNEILCLKGRDYCSSVPVRYVPKTPRRIKESKDKFPRKSLERNELAKNLDTSDELRNKVVKNGGSGVKGSVVPVEKSLNRNRNEISSKNNRLFDDEAKQVEKLQNRNRNEISSKNNLLFDDEAKQVEKLKNQNRNEISSKNNLLFDNEAKQVEKLRNQNRNEISSKNNVLFDNEAKQGTVLSFFCSTSCFLMKPISNLLNGCGVWLVEKLRNRNKNEISSKNNLLFDNEAKQVEKLQNRNRNEISSKNNVLFDAAAKQVEKLRNQNQNEISSMNNLLFDDDAKQEFEEEVKCDSGVAEFGLMVELGEVNEESEEMEIPRENNIHEQKVVLAGKSMEDAENSAIKLLAKRAFSAVELRKKLIGKRFLPDTVEEVLKDFQSRGLINDSLYAETYSRSRWSSSTWGPRRIKQALFNKGIQNTDAEKAVKLVFKDAESDDDQESKLGMSKLSMDHLFVQASKQWLRSQDAPKETRKVRIVRWLQYRGFNWGVTNFILKRLESQYPA
ncbi:hypothetical protein Dsin_023492 [Dipteronia sinensis]|uniref:Regulatory protein RecX n=1 Tax=Dipteronia sinensis TaxID=43782 RepID=A0AAE0A4D9_9ROSI|nr:hypothetical protein Dsin_023492 [Dipteronia sinensis]